MKKIVDCFGCCLIFCLLLTFGCSPKSEFDRTVEDDCFSLDCTMLNTTLAERYTLEEGDLVVLTHSNSEGRFTFEIGKEGQLPIYTGDDSAPERFTVRIPEHGTYTLSVTGEQAKGQVAFRIFRSK